MKFSFAAGCMALATLGFNTAGWADQATDYYNRLANQQADQARSGALEDWYITTQEASRRAVEALNRQATELQSPHWVCWLSVYPEAAKRKSDGCTLIDSAWKANELVEERRQYLGFALGTLVAGLSLWLALASLRFIWRRLANAATNSAGAVAL